MIKNVFYVIVILILCFILYRIVFVDLNKEVIVRTKRNYEVDVKEICRNEGISHQYIMALIVLECSGQKPPQSRFEAGVYDKLKQLRNGDLTRYSTLTASQVRGLPDSDLRLLATSWGPLQLMGYHCYELGVPVDALYSSSSALRVAIKWCKRNYGKYLQDGDFANAFHFHNTGKPMPVFGITTTYDPQYVFKGVRYMESF